MTDPKTVPSSESINTTIFRVGLACCAGVLAALAIPLVTGKVYTHIDLGAFHLTTRAFYQDCLRNGDSFLWEPRVLCGHYIHGEGQGGFLHPYHYLLYRFLPLQVAFNLELLLCYPAILAGCYFLFRRWSMSRAAALLAAFFFAFSGFGLLRAVHMHLVEMAVHLPWLLLAIDSAFTAATPRHRIGALCAVALLTGSELLIGYPQFVWIIGIAEGAYTIVLTIRHRRWATPFLLLIAKCIGFFLGAAQWLPSYDYLINSDRVLNADALRDYLSLHPLNLLQLVNPFLFNYGSYYGNLQEFTLYAGVVCTFLLGWAVVRFRRLGSARRCVGLLGAGAVIALLLAFGPYTGFHRLVNWIPLVTFFKGPCRYLILFFFPVAAIAGFGFDHLLRTRTEAPKRLWSAMAIAAVLALFSWALAGLAYSGLLDEPFHGDVSPSPLLWWGPLALTVCAVLIAGATFGARAALPLLFVLAALDQSLYGLHFLYWWSTPTTIEGYEHRYPAPDDVGPYRLYSSLKPERNGWVMSGYSLANGFAGILPRRDLVYDNDAAFRAAGVAYKEKPGARYYTNDNVTPEPDRWIPVADPVQRVYLVSSVRVSDNPATDIQRIDLHSTALVERPLNVQPGLGEAGITESHPGDVRIRVDVDSPQLLVFDESYHPGWTAEATPEHRNLEVSRVNGDFMGVLVRPGDAEVRFRFAPESYRDGLWLSGSGGVLLLVFLGAMMAVGRAKHGSARTDTHGGGN